MVWWSRVVLRREQVGESYSALVPLRQRLAMLLFPICIGLMTSACSLTMHLTSLQVDPETTASIGTPSAAPLGAALDDEDWRRAQAALSLAVDPQGAGLPVNWDNPASKRRGSFVQTGNMVLSEQTICRPFSAVLVDHLSGGAPRESKHEGRACRTGPGEWAMRDVKPVGAVADAKSVTQALPPKSMPLMLSSEAKDKAEKASE